MKNTFRPILEKSGYLTNLTLLDLRRNIRAVHILIILYRHTRVVQMVVCISSFAAFCQSIKHDNNLSSYSLFVIIALLSYICTPELIVLSVMSNKASILAMLHEKFTFHGIEWQFYQHLHHEIQMQSDLSCGNESYSTKEPLLLEVERQRQISPW